MKDYAICVVKLVWEKGEKELVFKGFKGGGGAVPDMPAPEPENVPPYVLTNILAPLKNDDCIHFADLDFEAFTEEDIDSLYREV